MSNITEVRDATERDIPDITRIYNHAILNTTATFDTVPKNGEQWRKALGEHSPAYPLIVATVDGQVAGWGALKPAVNRPAARFTAENAVYVDPDRQGLGVGTAILSGLVERARENSYHAIIALVVAGNEASVQLHRKCGFEEVGRMREVGWKFDKWLDLLVMERLL